MQPTNLQNDMNFSPPPHSGDEDARPAASTFGEALLRDLDHPAHTNQQLCSIRAMLDPESLAFGVKLTDAFRVNTQLDMHIRCFLGYRLYYGEHRAPFGLDRHDVRMQIEQQMCIPGMDESVDEADGEDSASSERQRRPAKQTPKFRKGKKSVYADYSRLRHLLSKEAQRGIANSHFRAHRREMAR